MRQAQRFALLLLCAASSATTGQAVGQTNVTVDATTKRSIGGVKTLDRPRYFNHWGTHTSGLGGFADELISPTGLNTVTGRETFELDFFVAAGLNEDPANPGFFRDSDLTSRLQGNYRNWVLNEPRWESLREHPNPVFVQSGRANGSWPSWVLDGTTMPMKNGGAAYAQLATAYFEEVVYGTGPGQGYLPFDPERFYFEIMNEPQLELYSGVTWPEVIDMHRTVTETVKAQFPQAQIGGASVGDQLAGPHRWLFAKQMMDDMATWTHEFDFWSIHPYECYHMLANGQLSHQTKQSPSHLNALMDLFETHSQNLFGEPKQFAVTEYGAWAHTSLLNGSFGTFTRDERQWYVARDTIEKLMVFLERPDRIVNATPFIAPQWFTASSPTEEAGAHHAMWERLANGTYQETILGKMYRMYKGVAGEYVEVGVDGVNTQAAAFRDGDKLHVLLNNLSDSGTTLNLSALTGESEVTAASISSVFWNGTEGALIEDLDVSSGFWQNLTLASEQAAVLTLTLDSAQPYTYATEEATYYADQIETFIGAAGSEAVNILGAETEDAISAKVRIGYSRTGAGSQGEGFVVNFNGTEIVVPATGVIGFDDDDTLMVTREVDVPLGLVQEGANSVSVEFAGLGGQLLTATLVVTKSLGDFNGSGAFDGEDLALLFAEFGAAAPGSRFDLVEDGAIDMADVVYWSEELRGVDTPSGDFNGDGLIDAADYTLIRDAGGAEFEFNYEFWRRHFGQTVAGGESTTVPEPSVSLLAISAVLFCWPWTVRRARG